MSSEEVKVITNILYNSKYGIRNRALFVLGVRTGRRVSELLRLRVKDVVGPNGNIQNSIYFLRRWVKGKTEGYNVPLHQEAREVLQELANDLRARGYYRKSYLFRNYRANINKPISRNQAWQIMAKAYKQAGLSGKLATHSMRKTFAQRMAEKLDWNLFDLAEAMGHANINSTAKYLSARTDRIRQAILE